MVLRLTDSPSHNLNATENNGISNKAKNIKETRSEIQTRNSSVVERVDEKDHSNEPEVFDNALESISNLRKAKEKKEVVGI